MGLTDRTCQKKASGRDEWIPDAGRRGAGRLYLRITKAGARLFYFRYTSPDGGRVNLKIGEYDQEGSSKGRVSLRQAAEKADELSRLYQAGYKDLRTHLDREKRAREDAARAEEEARRRADEDARCGTLESLLNGYVEYLERRGKVDARDVKNLFKNHVLGAYPELCARKANAIRPAELRPVLAKIIDQGKGRTAAKVRSYVRAAYAAAIRAEHDPMAPASLLGFGLETNPADVLATLKEFNKAGDRTLDEAELRRYVLALDNYPDQMTRKVLKLALLLGGQRPTQLLRVRPVDVDLTAETITLRDPKGARTNPRLHVLPLFGEAKEIVSSLVQDHGTKAFLFAQTDEKPIYRELLSGAAAAISAKLQEDKISRAPFRLGDIRRTCETMLAALGVSSDVRAQIQSHGLSGVQARHYDRHSYAAEKRRALAQWGEKIRLIHDRSPKLGQAKSN